MTGFRPDLIGTEEWDYGNTYNGDGEDASKKVIIPSRDQNYLQEFTIILSDFLSNLNSILVSRYQKLYIYYLMRKKNL